MMSLKNCREARTVYRVSELGVILKYREWKKINITVLGFGQKNRDDLQRLVDFASLYKIPIPDVINKKIGAYLGTPKTEKSSENGETRFLKYGLSAMQGWRSTMEDSHAAVPYLDKLTSFFAVYDGHGGKAVSKFCSKFLHEQMLRSEAYSDGDITKSARLAFLRMDKMMSGQRGQKELEILEGDTMGKSSGKINDWPVEDEPESDYAGPTTGCTACVVIIRKKQLLVANAGDTRCAYKMSIDHKPELKKETDRILGAFGFIQNGCVNGMLHVSRSIGYMQLKKDESLPPEKQILTANPDIRTFDVLEDDEFLLIASAAVWDQMTIQQAVDFVHECILHGEHLTSICEKILDNCIARKAEDKGTENMTIILVLFKKTLDSRKESSASERPPHRR